MIADHLQKADFIFIDGDHSYEGVLMDTTLARKMIKPEWINFGNPIVPSVSMAINHLNLMEGDRICLIEGGTLCFQFYRSIVVPSACRSTNFYSCSCTTCIYTRPAKSEFGPSGLSRATR
ncbi:hypothetical protein ACFPPD_08710 [Cohnella suwonensis]|uniref:Class I SAM-dependent methyltransferase n=1 Tax=Cohnella suwonensis TaxID=696072 RepID=A0ABW0LW14_9BACL